MRGLYVHIPFCLKKCHYCNYVISVDSSSNEKETYFRSLEKEIHHISQKYKKLHFDTVYFGGGTPSALNGNEMDRIIQLLSKNFTWDGGCEFTCEVNPGEIDKEKLEKYYDLGINRISLGVQSFDDALLEEMGRAHNSKMIFDTTRLLKETGFENISFDLIVRLPNQNLDHVKESLGFCTELGAKQVVIYDLNVHEKTVFGVRQMKNQLPLPPEESHLEMINYIGNFLIQNNFIQYEIASFAKKGFESKHNLNYWKNNEYLGLGPGAFSYLDKTRYQFASSVSSYIEKCSKEDWGNEVEDLLSDEQIEIETALTGLRLKEGIDLSQFKIIKDFLEKELSALEGEELVKKEGGKVFLTSKGKKVPESIFERLSSTV